MDGRVWTTASKIDDALISAAMTIGTMMQGSHRIDKLYRSAGRMERSLG